MAIQQNDMTILPLMSRPELSLFSRAYTAYTSHRPGIHPILNKNIRMYHPWSSLTDGDTAYAGREGGDQEPMSAFKMLLMMHCNFENEYQNQHFQSTLL